MSSEGAATFLARRALSDGYLTNGEYDAVIDAADAARAAKYRALKERIKAQAIEAGTAKTEGLGARHESAGRKAAP